MEEIGSNELTVAVNAVVLFFWLIQVAMIAENAWIQSNRLTWPPILGRPWNRCW